MAYREINTNIICWNESSITEQIQFDKHKFGTPTMEYNSKVTKLLGYVSDSPLSEDLTPQISREITVLMQGSNITVET